MNVISEAPERGRLAVLASSARKVTFDEFIETMDEDDRAEWVDGDIVFMSAVTTRHFRISQFLTRLFDAYLLRFPIGEIYYSDVLMKTRRGRSGRLPDIMFISNERLGTVKASHVDEPADLVVEVVSADSRIRDRRDKYVEYEEGGVREYWIIDPQTETADFLRLLDGKFSPVALDEDSRYRCSTLPGLSILPAWLWQETLPSLKTAIAEAIDTGRE
jgi:Uma2 family endonuclease